jgi:hypothetical protein
MGVATAPAAEKPSSILKDLSDNLGKSDKYIPPEKKQEFEREVTSKLDELMENLIQGAMKYIEPAKWDEFREHFEIHAMWALSFCVQRLCNDALASSDGDSAKIKEIWRGLYVKAEMMYRRFELRSPSSHDHFTAALWWIAERGGEEDLKLLREIRRNPPYTSDDIIRLLGIAEEKIAERVDDPEYVVRKGEEAYQQNRDSWDRLYQGEHIAICRGEVIDSDVVESALVERLIRAQGERGPFRAYVVEVGAPVLSVRQPSLGRHSEPLQETGVGEGEAHGRGVQRLGWDTFREQLPRLLEQSAGRWVAFHGQRLVVLADAKGDVYKHLVRENIPLTEVIVCRIGPLGPPLDLRRHRGLRVT